ncbi:GlxA family transcriptional regulator [Rhodovibrionaceae bacterium A322]
MLCVSAATEALRAANQALGWEAFAWSFYSVGGAAALSSNGISIDVEGPVLKATEVDMIFVVAGLVVDPAGAECCIADLRRFARQGVPLGASSGGSYLLARAGLLDGYRCTLHWEDRPNFVASFPHLDCSNSIYEIDRDRLTCAGGLATLDVMLRLVADEHGQILAEDLANRFQYERIRGEGDQQRPSELIDMEGKPALIRRPVERMMQNIQSPLSVAEIARLEGMSQRSLERIFHSHLGCAPAKFYKRVRLEYARSMLITSAESILEIAVASGFGTSSYFAKCYREHFGSNPSDVRREGLMPLAADVLERNHQAA